MTALCNFCKEPCPKNLANADERGAFICDQCKYIREPKLDEMILCGEFGEIKIYAFSKSSYWRMVVYETERVLTFYEHASAGKVLEAVFEALTIFCERENFNNRIKKIQERV